MPNHYCVISYKPVFLSIAFSSLLLAGCIDSNDTPKIFEDVSLSSGLDKYMGMTHGVAWGDYDKDGLADLYVTNHLNSAQLFHNLGTGHFADVSAQLFKAEDLGGDKHGAVWADMNNDGLLDLVQLTGAGRGVGAEPKRLFINHGDKFADLASSLGVANEYGRTRMPLAVDIDHNGLLDLFHGAEARFDKRLPPHTFLQQDNDSFIAHEDALPIKGESAPFCIMTELNGDANSELVCRVVGQNRTAQIFDTATLPAKDLDWLPVSAFEDIAAGDFDNDGAIDLFLARKSPSGDIAFGYPQSHTLIADVLFNAQNLNSSKAFSFQSSGDLTFQMASAFPHGLLKPNMIHIGQNDLQPNTLSFSVSKETAGIAGVIPANDQAGVYLRYIAPNTWHVSVLADNKLNKYQQFAFKISSTEAISNVSALNEAEKNEATEARLFMNRDGKLLEESEQRGINKRLVSATNVVTGDFDNDMDLDLFVLASGDIGKQENLLLLNRGDGYFSVIAGAGGAAGNKIGVGDSVTTVDFDNDGFLDLLTTTGGSMGRSLGIPSDEGAYKLYHNIGNGNHWLEIDLEGTSANRDALGAIVKISAGGVTQTRVQDGGVHHRSQNAQRLHFGLGKNNKIDKIQVQWPGGKMQELIGIETDRVLQIKEPAT
ncbi:MAG: CRTAC1 family protein [Methyloprofundus sp.]|nr:CRTAC1 family protein [Methyloprofundus sp.]